MENSDQSQITPPDLPKAPDVLVVGAGPGGTAAAFRAVELGLSVLVIDRSEAMSILKSIEGPGTEWIGQDYGGGAEDDPFPAGQSLIEALRFGPKVRAGELGEDWKSRYLEHSVPLAQGVELRELAVSEGRWQVRCHHSSSRQDLDLRARFVILATGRELPVHLAIPGGLPSPEPIHDLERFVGAPACVIGYGDAAAKAVIAISTAKARAQDKTEVFWSYRGSERPWLDESVARELSGVIQSQPNVRDLARSLPLVSYVDEDGQERIAIKATHQRSDGEPSQATIFEFERSRVQVEGRRQEAPQRALSFLSTLGLEPSSSAGRWVSALYETTQPNLFIIGDLLLSMSGAGDSPLSPETEAPVSHRGSLKASMREGVLVIEAIEKRLAGWEDERIEAFLSARYQEFVERHRAWKNGEPWPTDEAPNEEDSGQESGQEMESSLMARFVVETESGGTGREYEFAQGHSALVKSLHPDDPSLAENTAVLIVDEIGCKVADESGTGDTFIGIQADRVLKPGECFLAGKNTLRVDVVDGGMALAILDVNGQPARLLSLDQDERFFNRDSVDSTDLRLSRRRHFSAFVQGDSICLRDAGSTNGTFLKVEQPVRLHPKDRVLVGTRGLRFLGLEKVETVASSHAPMKEGEPAPAEPVESSPHEPIPEPLPPVAPHQEESEGRPVVELDPLPKQDVAGAREEPLDSKPSPAPQPVKVPIQGPPSVKVGLSGKSLRLDPEQSLLDAFREEGLSTTDSRELTGSCQGLWECGMGRCGLCIVEVLEGGANLREMSSAESKTLAKASAIVGLDIEKCRLACQAKSTGPVVVRLLGNTEG